MNDELMIENQDAVKAWAEEIVIPTYEVKEADPNPMFFEHRNIQGAKGNIYPVPFTDSLSSEKIDKKYLAVFLENEYLELILIPELGGRIFAARDKTNGYDFFYRHTVIKPALIGVCGPWISGGVEFNWPQHHRPSTFSPVDYTLESKSDGSKIVWMGEHDPFNRTKGMVGICLHPGKAIIETKVRLYNRTSIPQTFLWWQNAGVHINEKYQVIFPPDVNYSVFHAKAAVTRYPVARGRFYNNDYGDGLDLSWYINSPNATSFFAGDSKYEFFGGYDHAVDSGLVHVASRHISPGKKFFTWGSGSFGRKWQDNLMDDEGDYLELMAGVYTDNQPDFTWIKPFETKVFSQYWYPVQKIGAMKNANIRCAVNLEVTDGNARIGVYTTEVMHAARIVLSDGKSSILNNIVDLGPGEAFNKIVDLPTGTITTELLLQVLDHQGSEVIRYRPEAEWDEVSGDPIPAPYTPPGLPSEISSNDELYLIGLHLEQYRHPFVSAHIYWEEAIHRDPGDSRTHIALGRDAYSKGDLEKAEHHLRAALDRLTSRNLNPFSGEAHYYLGLTLLASGKPEEAYDALYKATWDYAWKSASFYQLALVDTRQKHYHKALQHLDDALKTNSEHSKARCLKAAIYRNLGLLDEADEIINATILMDPLDIWARHEFMLIARQSGIPRIAQQRLDDLHAMTRSDVQTYLDVILDYTSAGLYEDTFPLVGYLTAQKGIHPMVAYIMACISKQLGNEEASKDWLRKGAAASPDYCFPWRLEEMQVLEKVIKIAPDDSRAHYYLGNLLYDKKQVSKAIEHWKRSVEINPEFSIPWRNLALAAYNQENNIDAALSYIQKANQANPGDPRILLEYDQLLYRKARPAAERLELYKRNPDVVNQRDDLVSQCAMLYNCVGMPEKAIELTQQRTFHPWEGGEGSVVEHYANAHWLLGRAALDEGNAADALSHFEAGLDTPANLGEVPNEAETIHLVYYSGLAHAKLGEAEKARDKFENVLACKWDEFSIVTYFQGLALKQLGRAEEGDDKLRNLLKKSEEMANNPPGSGYFYYGNPSPVFEDDPKKLQRIYFNMLAGLARSGLGDKTGAASVLGQVVAVDPTRLIAHEEYKRL